MKKTNPIIEKEKPKVSFFDEYYNMRLKDRIPMTNLGISALAEEYYDWGANNDDAIAPSDFYLKKGIDQRTFNSWLKRSEELQQAHGAVMELIGNRRELRGLNRTYDSGIVRYTMPRYSNAYKKLEEWRASLREAKKEESGTKIVIMEKFGAIDKE